MDVRRPSSRTARMFSPGLTDPGAHETPETTGTTAPRRSLIMSHGNDRGGRLRSWRWLRGCRPCGRSGRRPPRPRRHRRSDRPGRSPRRAAPTAIGATAPLTGSTVGHRDGPDSGTTGPGRHHDRQQPTPAAGAAAADDASSRPRVPTATQVPQGAEDRSGELGDEVGRYAAPRELPGAARPSVTAASPARPRRDRSRRPPPAGPPRTPTVSPASMTRPRHGLGEHRRRCHAGPGEHEDRRADQLGRSRGGHVRDPELPRAPPPSPRSSVCCCEVSTRPFRTWSRPDALRAERAAAPGAARSR